MRFVPESNRWERLLHHEEYDLVIDGMSIRVHDGVFSPDLELTYSSSMMLKYLPDVSQKVVLDVGSGTGVVALKCAMKGAEKVVAVDVSVGSLNNIRENVERFGLTDKVQILESDLFSRVEGRFDYIFANLPILDEAWSQEQGGTQHLVQRFLNEVSKYLHKGGTAFLTWGSFADVEPLRTYLGTLDMDVKETKEEVMGFTWYLFSITRQ